MSVTLVVGALVLGSARAALAGTPGWNDAFGDGRVTVPADRSMIKVWNAKVDNLAYKAVWHNDNPIDARKPFEVRAPQGGCATDSSLFGSVKVFKLCQGQIGTDKRVKWGACRAAVWPGGR
ncbi:hypothetical protein [Microbispora rosea]|uniref:hypothetical protein n=1 Tax=Microbispora rosea TaxID=58117 RepID=UPI0004C406A0|nr:hypothetical protein [Microbispora rosea]